MKSIFISYAHDDVDYRNTIIHETRRKGYEAWVDSEDLRAGKEWKQPIDDAIRDSLAVIVIITPNSAKSQYVTYEWTFALGAGVPVIPIKFEETDLHPRLTSLNWLDFIKKPRPTQQLVDELIKAETDYNPMRSRTMGDKPPIVQKAIQGLDDLDEKARRIALENLIAMNQIEVLEEATRHPAPDVSTIATLNFAKLTDYSDKRAELPLLKILESKSFQSRKDAAYALGLLGSQAAIPALLVMLDRNSSEEKSAAIAALGRIKYADVIPKLKILLSVNDIDLATTIMTAFRRIGDPQVIPEAIQYLKFGYSPCVIEALKIVSMFKATEAVPEIAGLLESNFSLAFSQEISSLAISTLVQLGDSRAIPYLERALRDRRGLYEEEVLEALYRLGWVPSENDEAKDASVLVIEEKWDLFLNALQRYSRTSTDVVRYFHVVRVDGNRVVLGTDNEVFFKRLQPYPEKRKIIESALQEVYGIPFELEIVFEETNQ